ncbi:hypothetical protein CBR_g778 [Chara braunii]|uniref:Uncharacterized protein n=1 Tax=Chara braunii TaxID=69332 RepID=A0A388KC73_CHABU|nr:hypothetical protein CBR_g778 [Chara braunii]|eukprot:GBG67650.1 hypothetical protein CBR_g778 [Chara braunii]
MTGATQMLESGHSDVVHDVQLDYYGKRLATCSSDRLVKIFNVAGDQQSHVADLAGHEGPIWEVAWAHPKFGNLLASCSYDRRVIIWKETTENTWVQLQVFLEHESSVNGISWAPHEYGLIIAAASSDGTISIHTCGSDGSWETVKINQAHPVGCTSVSWAPSTTLGSPTLGVHRLVSGGCDNAVKVWRLQEGRWRMDWPALSKHTDWVRDVAWAPNLGIPKNTIASASQDGTVVIWTQENDGDQWEGKVIHDFKTPVWRVSWSLTGTILAVADGNHNVTLWKESLAGDWGQVSTVQ